MIRACLALVPLLLCVACGEVSPEEQARRDARDLALVEAANEPPLPQTVSPQPIMDTEVQESGLSGTGCTFFEEGTEGDRLAIAIAETAALKLEGNVKIFAADSGSAEMPFGTSNRYTSREHVLDLQVADDWQAGDKTRPNWKGRLTIRDPYERVVYTASGIWRCAN